MIVSLVRFTPSARTNWHSDAMGQTLHVTDGVGLVAPRNGTVIRLGAGTPCISRRVSSRGHR
jgi:quercetin dioxygenase-like cupin family protein